jgi:hypothetical protein
LEERKTSSAKVPQRAPLILPIIHRNTMLLQYFSLNLPYLLIYTRILTGVVGEKFVSSAKSFYAIHMWNEQLQAYMPQHRIRAIYLPEGGIVPSSR